MILRKIRRRRMNTRTYTHTFPFLYSWFLIACLPLVFFVFVYIFFCCCIHCIDFFVILQLIWLQREFPWKEWSSYYNYIQLVCVYVHMCIYMCVCMYIFNFEEVKLYASIEMSKCTNNYIYIYIYVCVCVCVYECVCVLM